MNDTRHEENEEDAGDLREGNLQLPTYLDEQSIAGQWRMMSRSNPRRLPAMVRTMRERLAYGIGGWAERVRLGYLQTLLQQVQVSHEISSQSVTMNDEWDEHQKRRRTQFAELAAGVSELEAQAKAEELRLRIENAKTAQAEARKTRIKLTQGLDITEVERRKEALRSLNEEIAHLETRRSQVLADHLNGRAFEELSESEQDEYRADQNSYSDRIRQAKDRRIDAE